MSLNSFCNWSTPRKLRMLNLMDDYVKHHASENGKYHWHNNYPLGSSLDETMLIRGKIASNDELFVNALWAFCVSIAGDIDWLGDMFK